MTLLLKLMKTRIPPPTKTEKWCRFTNVVNKGNLTSKSGTATEQFRENKTTSKLVLCLNDSQICQNETQETTTGITVEMWWRWQYFLSHENNFNAVWETLVRDEAWMSSICQCPPSWILKSVSASGFRKLSNYTTHLTRSVLGTIREVCPQTFHIRRDIWRNGYGPWL